MALKQPIQATASNVT